MTQGTSTHALQFLVKLISLYIIHSSQIDETSFIYKNNSAIWYLSRRFGTSFARAELVSDK